MTTLLAIANDEAGSSSDNTVDEVIQALSVWAEVTFERTSSPGDLDHALAHHTDADVVAILGGDGSLHAVIGALHRAELLTRVCVALIPLGTGNDYARTIGLDDDPVIVATHLRDADERLVDLIRNAHGDLIVNAAHIGVGAEAAATAVPWKKWLGPIGYAVGALTSGLTRPGVDLSVTIDGQQLPTRGRVAQVAVGNGQFVGGGAPLFPGADPSDGWMDIAVSYASSLPRRLTYGWAVSRGQHRQRDDVIYRRGRDVSVTGDPTRCTSDGELSDPSAEHSWSLQPSAVRILIPRSVSE